MYGIRVENQNGANKFLYLYFTAGIGGNLLSALLFPYTISIGASGAIFGLIGLEGSYLYINYNK